MAKIIFLSLIMPILYSNILDARSYDKTRNIFISKNLADLVILILAKIESRFFQQAVASVRLCTSVYTCSVCQLSCYSSYRDVQRGHGCCGTTMPTAEQDCHIQRH